MTTLERYALEYKDSPTNPAWTSSTALPGNSAALFLNDQNGLGPQRVYRVRVLDR
jgi:hypothetical protein